MKKLKIHKFPFKNVIVLAIECKMYLKIQQKLRCLGCISKQTMRSALKKTRLNSSKDDFLMNSFPSSTKRKMSILLNFLFPFFVFCIFNLEMQNSCLKTSAWWSRGTHCVENGYPSLRLPKYGKSEYSRALNASYTFQPVMSFWFHMIVLAWNHAENHLKYRSDSNALKYVTPECVPLICSIHK